MSLDEGKLYLNQHVVCLTATGDEHWRGLRRYLTNKIPIAFQALDIFSLMSLFSEIGLYR